MRRARRRAEPVLALINVVFLLLVFFLIAGQLARPLPAGVTLATIDPGAPPPDPAALVITRDGRLYWGGVEMAPDALAGLSGPDPLRVMPDRDLPAAELMALARALAAAGVAEIRLSGARR